MPHQGGRLHLVPVRGPRGGPVTGSVGRRLYRARYGECREQEGGWGGPKTGVLSRTVFWVWGGFLGLGEVRDLYRKVGDIGGLHFHQVPSKSVPRGAKTSQKTVYLGMGNKVLLNEYAFILR